MSDYGDQGSNDTKSEAASPLAAELNNGGLHPSAASTASAARHHQSSAPSSTPTAGVDRGHTPPYAVASPLMYGGGGQHQLHGLESLVDAGLRCPPLTAGAGLDDDGGFLAMNMAAAAAAAAAAGTFNLGYRV